MKQAFWAIFPFMMLLACEDSRLDIPSVEERTSQASKELMDELTDPPFGWRLQYKPTNNAGIFLILLNFNSNGTVRIQSDVSDEGGIYLDQTISYRIDQDLETELILETYAVFHYLFELNQNSFGAEFEFLFEEKDDENLIFTSKSDVGIPTELVFQPAAASDPDLISSEIIAQLAQGSYRFGSLAGIIASPTYQIYVPSDNVSIFTSFDLGNRRAKVFGAAFGRTFEEVSTTSVSTAIDLTTDLSFINEEVFFESPVSFTLAGSSYSLSSFRIADFQVQDTIYCSQNDTYVAFDASFSSNNWEMISSLFASHSNFVDDESEFYQISDVFMYDEKDSTIQSDVLEAFPNSIVFVLVYNGIPRGFEDGTFTGLGWVGVDENSALEFYLREMNVTDTSGNLLEFELMEGTFITVPDSLEEKDALFSLTDQIFEGGALYATEILSSEDLFEIYNPCNGYKFFLTE
ncbi:MAG: DUF4302 domain-containing protein [Bacteroidota bacterium]